LTSGILFIVIDAQPADGNSVDQQVFQFGVCRPFQARLQAEHVPMDRLLAEQIGVGCQLQQGALGVLDHVARFRNQLRVFIEDCLEGR